MREQRNAVDQRDQSERQKFVEPDRQTMARAQTQHHLGDQGGEQPPDRESSEHAPHEIDK